MSLIKPETAYWAVALALAGLLADPLAYSESWLSLALGYSHRFDVQDLMANIGLTAVFFAIFKALAWALRTAITAPPADSGHR